MLRGVEMGFAGEMTLLLKSWYQLVISSELHFPPRPSAIFGYLDDTQDMAVRANLRVCCWVGRWVGRLLHWGQREQKIRGRIGALCSVRYRQLWS